MMITFRSDDGRELTKQEWITEYVKLSKSEKELVASMVNDEYTIDSCALTGAWLQDKEGNKIKKIRDTVVTKLAEGYIIENTTPRMTRQGEPNKLGKRHTYSVAIFRVIATLPQEVYK